MVVSKESFKPNHDTVLLKLKDNLKKLGFKKVDEESGIRVLIGPGVEGKLDLVVVLGYRTRGNRRGNALVLFEVKTEQRGLFPIVWKGLTQLDMYSLALERPDLYTFKESDRATLSNSLYYKAYLVIQKSLWDEVKELSASDKEKLKKLFWFHSTGIITYDEQYRFREVKDYGCPEDLSTEYLGKKIKRERIEKMGQK